MMSCYLGLVLLYKLKLLAIVRGLLWRNVAHMYFPVPYHFGSFISPQTHNDTEYYLMLLPAPPCSMMTAEFCMFVVLKAGRKSKGCVVIVWTLFKKELRRVCGYLERFV